MCNVGDNHELAVLLVEALRRRGYTFATAESCTGGAVAAAVTSVAGCSDVMRGGVVAYHNDIKTDVLGVDRAVLCENGAVSEPVVRQMVCGVSRLTGADCAVATSGVAGPGGGTVEKPVGTVWIAAKAGGEIVTKMLQLGDNGRAANISMTVTEVLRMANTLLE